MIQIYADGVLIYKNGVATYEDDVLTYDSRLEEYDLQALRITAGLNKGGTAEIVMPPYHPAANSYVGFRTIVRIYRDGALRFRGRALYPVDDVNNARTVVCEGELCFLQDGVLRPYLYQDTPRNIFASVVAEFNAQVEPFKQFKVGEVIVTDPNDYVRLESEDAETVLGTVNKLLERCGGYIVFTTDDTGARVINWLAEVGNANRQTIEAGENLFDFNRTGANTDLATALIPYGAKDDTTGERLTIVSVNGGKDYIKDDAAVAVRGTIMRPVFWDDVTDAQNLLRKAQQYLNECKLFVTSLTLTAFDLSYIDKSVESFKIGDRIRVVSRAHGVDEDFQLTESTEDMLNPGGSFITLGKEIRSLTSLDVAGDDKSRSELHQSVAAIKKDFDINVQASVNKALEGTVEELTSLIEQQADRITLEVSGSIGGKATITLTTAGGTVKTSELDLRQVRQAFANDTSAVEISGGTLTFNSGTLIVNSTNLQVSADGTIKATNAELSGTATTENGLSKSELSAGRLRFFYDGTEYGGIASDQMADDSTTRGVTVRLSAEASYMGFARLNPESEMYDLWYCLNFGANLGDRPERHLFYGTTYFANQMNVAGNVDFYGSVTANDIVTFNSTALFYGVASFINNATFNAAASFEKLATFNEAVKHNANTFFANGKGVAFYKTDGKTVFALNMTGDQLYVGTQDAPVCVYGSTTQLGVATYPTTLAGSSVTVNNSLFVKGAATFNNGYGVLVKDASGVAEYILSLTASNQVIVGNARFHIYLRGTGVTIAKGGLALDEGSVILANGYGVVGTDNTGATHYMLSMTSGNMVNVGASSYVTYLRGTAVYLASSGATVTSDERKKNSIELLPDAYDALLDKITPVRFKYNDGTSGRYHAGFIAQDVKAALAEVGLSTKDFGGFVDLMGDGEELGLIYSEFIALLLSKIKRQEQRIAALEAAQ